ncbi:MAG: lysophospholipid acyltransferase family protein [Gemmataceae bacterium]|nr:lysophospholipid acyltransferase family protein [Gemmataceae bacterium]MCI0740956.1 lysophospholipid acyltransferase family protein [Gemmataceae bacterium]
MTKERSPTLDWIVYALMRVVVSLIQALPFALACRLGEFIGWLGYRVDKRHRNVALENLRHAFPGQFSEDELLQLVQKVFQHFGLLLIEILFLPRRVNIQNWRRHFQFRTEEDVRRFLDMALSGRPVLLATGHFGNWELSGFVLGLLGVPLYAIARPLDNPYVDDYLRRLREFHGQKILAKQGDFEHIQEVLTKGGILGTLADQDAGQRGLFVEFFHRPASTHKALALLALEHKVPIVVLASVRTDGPLVYRALVEDVILPEEYEGRPDAIKAITQRYSTALEQLIRQYPEQYFWLHRRWKHQPIAKGKKKAA